MINGALNVIHTTGKLGDRERHLTTSLCLRDCYHYEIICVEYMASGGNSVCIAGCKFCCDLISATASRQALRKMTIQQSEQCRPVSSFMVASKNRNFCNHISRMMTNLIHCTLEKCNDKDLKAHLWLDIFFSEVFILHDLLFRTIHLILGLFAALQFIH